MQHLLQTSASPQQTHAGSKPDAAVVGFSRQVSPPGRKHTDLQWGGQTTGGLSHASSSPCSAKTSSQIIDGTQLFLSEDFLLFPVHFTF